MAGFIPASNRFGRGDSVGIFYPGFDNLKVLYHRQLFRYRTRGVSMRGAVPRGDLDKRYDTLVFRRQARGGCSIGPSGRLRR